MTPSSSLTILGPKAFLSALHCPSTLSLRGLRTEFISVPVPVPSLKLELGPGIEGDGTVHHPLRSTPPSPAPPTCVKDMYSCSVRNRRQCSSKARPISTVVRRIGIRGTMIVGTWLKVSMKAQLSDQVDRQSGGGQSLGPATGCADRTCRAKTTQHRGLAYASAIKVVKLTHQEIKISDPVAY
jgi:hypothetical protein